MHDQPQINLPDKQPSTRGPFSFALLVAGAAVVIVLAGFYLWPGRQSPSRAGAQQVHLPFGPEERAYAPNVKIENLALSRAENFLNQEVTTLAGEVVNTGQRSLREIEVTVEFDDSMNQIALRESRMALTPASPPLASGERRGFDVAFERIPPSWNMQLPSVRVTGLLFGASKQ